MCERTNPLTLGQCEALSLWAPRFVGAPPPRSLAFGAGNPWQRGGSQSQRRRRQRGKSASNRISAASARLRVSPARRRRRPTGSTIRRALLRGLYTTIALIALIIVGSFLYFVARLPDPILLTLDDRPPNLTILASDGTVLAERGLRRGYVRLDRLPPYLPQAVIATEDRRFYNHLGVDPVGLVRAGMRNLIAGSVVQGGSTITQQLAKNLFLSPDRTMARKLEEAMYAIWLERRFTKDEILELYLNRVYFGGGTYGVEAAARRYFGRSARSVTLTQAALLAGLLKAPSRYAPTRSVELATTRVDVVLDNMVEAGFLTSAEAETAAAEPLRLRTFSDETGYPYAVDWVAETLPEVVGNTEGDLVVETTIDAGLQRAAQLTLRQTLDAEGKDLDVERRRRGGARYQRRDQGADRRPLLPLKPLRPCREGAPPAWLGLQAFRLSHRARKRLHARLDRQ